jgi:radical SAM superfamily enzyme YgiQ (UPF0313 family)
MVLKIAVIVDKTGIASYTNLWLRYMVEKMGMKLAPPRRADILMVSCCDVLDFPILMDANKWKKPIILGGQETYNDNVYGKFATLLNVGEGFELFEELAKVKDLPVDKIIEHLKEMPYIYWDGKTEKTYPSDVINWANVPVAQTGRHKKMVLTGRGCHRKCKFCFTSWTTKYQNNPNVPKRVKNLMVISNDNSSEAELNVKAYVRSLTVRTYLNLTPRQAKNCSTYRFGIESFSEATRKWFGKPIKTDDLVQLYEISERLGHNLRLFIIAGFDPQESINEFTDALPQSTNCKPIIEIKGTYFNAQTHTPFEDFDIRELQQWDWDYIRGRLIERSHRFRLTLATDRRLGVWRTFWSRARTAQESALVWKWRDKKAAELLHLAEGYDMDHLFTEPNLTTIDFSRRSR